MLNQNCLTLFTLFYHINKATILIYDLHWNGMLHPHLALYFLNMLATCSTTLSDTSSTDVAPVANPWLQTYCNQANQTNQA